MLRKKSACPEDTEVSLERFSLAESGTRASVRLRTIMDYQPLKLGIREFMLIIKKEIDK